MIAAKGNCFSLVHIPETHNYFTTPGCFDFDDLVKDYLPHVNDIQQHFTIELEVENGVIFARSKPDMDDATPWGPRSQVFPPKVPPFPETPSPDQVPPTAPHIEWTNWEDIQKDLHKFYGGLGQEYCDIQDGARDRK